MAYGAALGSLAAALVDSRHVMVLTGSGASAECGVPTFREAQTGLWKRFDPHELATPAAFERDPALVWRWYRWRRELVTRAEPNNGHRALAELASRVPRLTLVTQNVDGLHQRAGSESVVELHGNLFANRCVVEDCDVHDIAEQAAVPRCRGCGGPVRPGVVWFGETIPDAALTAAASAAADCDLFLSVGTSSLVWPAAGFAGAVRRRGIAVAEINPDDTPLSDDCDFRLCGKAGSILPELVNSLPARIGQSEA
jgi:NAD-dependent deacetylase